MRLPDKQGHFGQFGGRYVPETLMPILTELEKAYAHYTSDREFKEEFAYYLRDYVGRPNPLYFAEKLNIPLCRRRANSQSVVRASASALG